MKSRQPRLSMKEHAKGPEGASLSEEYGSKVPQDAAALYRAIRGFEEKPFSSPQKLRTFLLLQRAFEITNALRKALRILFLRAERKDIR